MTDEKIWDLKQKLGERIQQRMDYARDYSDDEVREFIDEVLLDSEEISLYSVEFRRRIGRELFHSMRGLDIIQSFVEDSSVTEIMVNGTAPIFVEQKGVLRQLDIHFDSLERLQDVIQRIVAGCNRVVNEASPIVDARLSNGSRVNIVMRPVALNGPIVTIRRFPDRPVTLEWLVGMGALTVDASRFLQDLVQAGYNIFVSGGTGSGKTTFLNALSAFIPGSQRVITIEDSAELQLQGIPNLVRLETRNSNVEGCQEIGMREELNSQFKECILAVAASLKAGYAVENAFVDSRNDMKLLYGENSYIYTELEHIRRGLVINIALEELLADLAVRSGSDEIFQFAQVFVIAKKSGGRMPDIIQTTAGMIGRRIDARSEIHTLLSGRQMEQTIMKCMPFGILLYIGSSYPGYFDSFYHNWTGIGIMTGCLMVYLAAYVLGDKIMRQIARKMS